MVRARPETGRVLYRFRARARALVASPGASDERPRGSMRNLIAEEEEVVELVLRTSLPLADLLCDPVRLRQLISEIVALKMLRKAVPPLGLAEGGLEITVVQDPLDRPLAVARIGDQRATLAVVACDLCSEEPLLREQEEDTRGQIGHQLLRSPGTHSSLTLHLTPPGVGDCITFMNYNRKFVF